MIFAKTLAGRDRAAPEAQVSDLLEVYRGRVRTFEKVAGGVVSLVSGKGSEQP